MNQHTVAPRRLARSRREKMVFGVAGGLAQYFDIDPVLVRLGFVLLTLMTGVGLVAYIVLALVMPERHPEDPEPAISSMLEVGRGRQVAGLVLLAVGAMLLAGNFGWLAFFQWDRFWPLILVGFGAFLLVYRHRT